MVAQRIPWAELLKRIWGVDALRCEKCGGAMAAIAIIEDTDEIARYLAHVGLATPKQARGPPEMAA